jgi:hypothetical protein
MSQPYVKLYGFVQDMARKLHNLNSDAMYIALTNAAMTQSTSTTLGTIDLATSNGYVQGGASVGNGQASQSGGVLTFQTATTTYTWTATGGSIGPFEFVLLVNHTAGLIIGYWDYGSAITLNTGDQFVWTEGANIFTMS